jgi:hypothetical protein
VFGGSLKSGNSYSFFPKTNSLSRSEKISAEASMQIQLDKMLFRARLVLHQQKMRPT